MDPSFSHRRHRLGCRFGTFSPSRRQIRCTRLALPCAVPAKRRRHPPVAVAPILRRQADDVGGERGLVTPDPRQLALGGPGLTDRLTGPAFRDAELSLHM